MKKCLIFINVLLLTLSIISPLYTISKNKDNEIRPETWTYVDGLGRTDTSYGELQTEKAEHPRSVGIFYHTWHTEFSQLRVPVNINEVVSENPEAAIDVKTNRFWFKFERKFEPGYFWNEPIFGYYNTTDEYVLRKHAELLADAGVDFIFIDWTNGEFTWEDGMDSILKVFKEAREDGVKAPQIVFWISLFTPENRIHQLTTMYKRWYSNPEYDDMWFKLDGKPLVLGYSDVFDLDFEYCTEINNMFTFRRINPSYFNHRGSDPSSWGWLSVYPQCKYGTTNDEGRPEEIAVGVAQNANSLSYTLSTMSGGPNIMGRSFAALDYHTSQEYSYSYSYGGNDYIVDKRDDFATLAGRNFQQQWDFAIECDPNVVLVTGWNEWTSYRTSGFCDCFTDEYSRDVEPTKGALKDNYYYQLVANIRRYKGAEYSDWNVDDEKSIDIFSNDLSKWDNITSYNHYTGSTRDRNCTGYKECEYINYSMRNDIVTSKVAFDDNNFYFYVSTVDTLSYHTDPAWMRLFISTDESGTSPNWEGFEYVINRINPTESTCVLERSKGISENGEWLWETVNDQLRYSVKNNVLQIEVPKNLIGFDSDKFDFSFKWSDNMQVDGDIMDFYTNGDVAPGGRFCFRFQNIKNYNKSPLIATLEIILVCFSAIIVAILPSVKYFKIKENK